MARKRGDDFMTLGGFEGIRAEWKQAIKDKTYAGALLVVALTALGGLAYKAWY
jgi:hypothetical protein